MNIIQLANEKRFEAAGDINEPDDKKVRTRPCLVNSIGREALDTAILKPRFPPNTKLRIFSEPRVYMSRQCNARRSNSISNAKHDFHWIELRASHDQLRPRRADLQDLRSKRLHSNAFVPSRPSLRTHGPIP